MSSYFKTSPFRSNEIIHEIYPKFDDIPHLENYLPPHKRPLEIVFSGETLGDYQYKKDTNTYVLGYANNLSNRIVIRAEKKYI